MRVIQCLLLQVKSTHLRSCISRHTNYIDLSDTIQVDSTSSDVHDNLLGAGVTDLDDVDVVSGMTDDDWCSSDKENDVVFPYHHTASVVAMERIFAKQRLPNFVRPKGYISPLRCPALLRSAPVPSHVSLRCIDCWVFNYFFSVTLEFLLCKISITILCASQSCFSFVMVCSYKFSNEKVFSQSCYEFVVVLCCLLFYFLFNYIECILSYHFLWCICAVGLASVRASLV